MYHYMYTKCFHACHKISNCVLLLARNHFFSLERRNANSFWRNGFFMQTNAISSNLVRSRKNLCETRKHDRILKRNALSCHGRGHFFPRICWTPVRMHVRISPFSRYFSSRVIMCTITCNQMLSCLVENKQLLFFARPQPYFFH